MAGIRQTAAFEYASSDKVQTEFENVIRYLQQAEVGGKTLGEVIDNLTDDDGNLNSNVEFRLDSAAGLQYRVGETGDFITVAPLSDLRGETGQNVGDIGAPIFNGRQDYIIGTTLRASDGVAYPSGTTVLEYQHTADDTIVVFRNGLIQVGKNCDSKLSLQLSCEIRASSPYADINPKFNKIFDVPATYRTSPCN